MQTDVTSLDSKLGDAADDPTYIFTEPRFGYRMWKGEMGEARPSATPLSTGREYLAYRECKGGCDRGLLASAILVLHPAPIRCV